MFSISTVASSTSIPTASAIPPSVIVLIVWPARCRHAIDVRIDSGIDAITISMLRGDPMNISTINATSAAAITASRTTSHSDARTNADWSKVSATLSPLGATARISGMRARDRIDD